MSDNEIREGDRVSFQPRWEPRRFGKVQAVPDPDRGFPRYRVKGDNGVRYSLDPRQVTKEVG